MQQNRTTLGLLLLVLITGSIKLRAQSLQLHVDPHPSPYLSDWQQHRQTAFITLGNTGSSTISHKIGTQLYDGADNLIAETDISKMPVMQLNPGAPVQYFFEDIYPVSAVKYHGNYDVSGTARSGKIKDDNYRLCVQMLDAQTGAALVAPQCRYFSIVAFQQPTLISPRQGETIARNAVRRPMLRWTPVQPSYPGIVTYRLQVMEVLPGQEPGQAFRANQPIMEKDFKRITQTVWPLEFQLPDADMSYVWSVQALDEQDRPIGENEGRAEYYSFNIRRDVDPKGRPSIALLIPANNSTTDVPSFKWTPVQPSRPGDGVTYRLRIVEIKGQESPEEAYRVNKPILEKDYKNISSVVLPGAPSFDTGKTYVWWVQALDDAGKGIGENEGRSEYASFRLNKPMMDRYDRRIMLTSPANNSTTDEPSFKWTPVQPSMPGDGVTYRLRIVEVKGDQSPEEAYHRNKPMFEKDYKNRSSVVLPGARAFDTGKTYVWGVQALDDEGKGIGENEGRSEYASFRVNKPMMERDRRRIILTSPADNGTTDAPSFSWTPIQPSRPGDGVTYRLRIVELKGDQSPEEAYHRNKPMFEKDYKNRSSVTLPGKTGFDTAKTYVWYVQALDDEGKGIGENEGRSEYATFKVKDTLPGK